jgi:hypothetical protein
MCSRALICESGKPFYASKGSGTYHHPKASPDRFVAEWSSHWHGAKQSNGIWLYHLHSDHWKSFTHARFMTPPLNDDGTHRRGSLSLFTPDETAVSA